MHLQSQLNTATLDAVHLSWQNTGGTELHSQRMNIDKLRTRAGALVTHLTTRDECEKRVNDALSNRSWDPHPTLMNEIAEDIFQYDR